MSDVGQNTFKCKFCDSPEQLVWPNVYKKGGKPVRAIDGKPHNCLKSKKTELGEHGRPERKYQKGRRDRSLQKDLPKIIVPNVPAFYLCGICDNGTEVKFCPDFRECVWCNQFPSFCEICNGHPNVVFVSSDKNHKLKDPGKKYLLPERQKGAFNQEKS